MIAEVMLAAAAKGEEPLTLIGRLTELGWWFELKFDGVRAVVSRTAEGSVRITNRRQRDITIRYPDVVADISGKLGDFVGVLDGEIVVLDANGRPDFAAIHARDAQSNARRAQAAAQKTRAQFVPFDILETQGEDVRGLTYLERRRLLEALVAPTLAISTASQDGVTMWEFVLGRSMEGLIAKSPDHRYQAGQRSWSWRKIKATRRLFAVVVGIQEGKGSRGRVGALSLRLWDTQAMALVDIGTVGSGLKMADRQFFEMWLKEEPTALVVEVEFLEVSKSGKLRMPVFKGVVTGQAVSVSVEMCTTDQPAYRRN